MALSCEMMRNINPPKHLKASFRQQSAADKINCETHPGISMF